MASSTLWRVPTGIDLDVITERSNVYIILPLVTGLANIEVEIISGILPRGTRLENNNIVGTAFEVELDTVSSVVIRAHWMEHFDDRTFKIKVIGPDSPEWLTPQGLLPIGNNNRYFILDNEIIDFQLIATDTDISAGDSLDYFIAEGEGTLPPGISLTKEGKLVGTTEPLLSLDKRFQGGQYDTQLYGELPFDYATLSSNGFSSYFYDSQVYDFATASQSLRKLNRYYPFTVTVTDGVTYTKRNFKIYMVGDDFLRADNTVMQSANGVFTADNTYVRTPVWITPRNLGFKRANNYMTIPLQIIEDETLIGAVSYVLDDFNDDGTPSVLPPGLVLDSNDGYIYGRVPYQPAVSRDYKFTINATRVDSDFEVIEIFGTYFEDVILGTNTFKIYKIDLTGNIDGINDLEELRNRYISINNKRYLVISVDGTNPEYDIIYVDQTLSPEISLLLTRTANIGQDYIFVERLQDPQREKYQSRTLKFAENELYVIQTVIPYLEYEVNVESMSYTAMDISQAFGGVVYIDEVEPNKWRIKLNSTIATRNVNRVKEFFQLDSDVKSVKLIQDLEDRISFNINLSRKLNQGRNIGLALFQNDFFSRTIVVTSEDETTRPSKSKTFELRVIGEIDSNIKWITGPSLGIIDANFTSTLQLKAESTVPDTQMVYTIKSGRLPNGMRLNYRGDIIGSPNQFSTEKLLGLTGFDNNTTSFDGKFPSDTTFDREFRFVVEARDRFGFAAIEQEFILTVEDLDNTLYTDLYVKPFMKPEIRQTYRNFINNPEVFDKQYIYRIDDTEFGIQREIKALVYAGIEAKSIGEFVAASAKNHTRKRFKIGDLKTAIAREPGTRNTIYEVIYLELLDPYKPTSGKTANSFKIKNSKKITVDSVQYETLDDNTGITGLDANRRRPAGNTLKSDSDAVKVSGSKDQTRYISNIDNMRNNLKQVGKNERRYLPLWMRTPQEGYQELDYVAAIPICFCNPGASNNILQNIKNSNFDFKQIDFDIDRYIIKRSEGNNEEQYILFANYQFNV